MDITDLDFDIHLPSDKIDDFNRLGRLLCTADKGFAAKMTKMLMGSTGMLDGYCLRLGDTYYKLKEVQDCRDGKVYCTAYMISCVDGHPVAVHPETVLMDGDDTIRQFTVKELLTNRIPLEGYEQLYDEYVDARYHTRESRDRFFLKDMFICDFDRKIRRTCGRTLADVIDAERYEDSERHSVRANVRCLGDYCDRKCELCAPLNDKAEMVDMFKKVIEVFGSELHKMKMGDNS